MKQVVICVAKAIEVELLVTTSHSQPPSGESCLPLAQSSAELVSHYCVMKIDLIQPQSMHCHAECENQQLARMQVISI